MVKLFKQVIHLFIRQQNTVFSAASVIMCAVLLSRVFGLLRDRLLAARFSPNELGVYYAAFRLPNMIFELLVMGALATAFIPVFTSYLDTKGREEAFKIASLVINFGLVVFGVFLLPVIFFATSVSSLLAPGFDKGQIELMASFTRIMLIAQVFPLIIGNFLTGILQSFRSFILPALAPVIYNIGIIIGIIVLTPFIGLYAPVIGVAFGALLFTIIQIPAVCSLGYRHQWCFSLTHPGIRSIGRLMLPRTFGLAVSQIDTTIDLALSTLLGASAVTVFNFAQHLQQLPVGLVGASIAQAILPSLSSLAAKKNIEEFKKMLLSSFHQILFLVIPLSIILIVLRIPVVRLVFGSSNLFDWNSTVTTGNTLAFFSISLFAQSLIHVLARSFYALQETKTPVVVGVISVLLNTILSLFFILYLKWDVAALGLSTTIANIFNMLLLLLYLDKKLGSFNRYHLFIPAFKITLAALVSGLALYIPIKLFDQLVFDTTRTINLIMLTSISTLFGLSVYFFLVWFLEVPQMATITALFKKAKRLRQRIIMDTTQEVINVQEREI